MTAKDVTAKDKTFTASETVKERLFDHDPRRHFEEKRLMLCERIVTQLQKDGYLTEELLPTGKPDEYTMTLTVRAVK